MTLVVRGKWHKIRAVIQMPFIGIISDLGGNANICGMKHENSSFAI